MKMIVTQETAPQDDTTILDLFAEHGAPEGTEQLFVSADGRQVFVIGDFEDMEGWNRLSELYQTAYAAPAQFIPVIDAEIAVANNRAGIAARS